MPEIGTGIADRLDVVNDATNNNIKAEPAFQKLGRKDMKDSTYKKIKLNHPNYRLARYACSSEVFKFDAFPPIYNIVNKSAFRVRQILSRVPKGTWMTEVS